MSIDLITARHRVTAILGALAVAGYVALPAWGHGPEKHATPEPAAAQMQEAAKFPSAQLVAARSGEQSGAAVRRARTRLAMPIMNPARGRELFVTKGCFACHAINGVGGHDAPAMDAHTMDKKMNPFDFAAKMWNHAAGMIAAQESAFGEQITLTGDELAHIVLFVHHDEAQHHFTEDDLTPKAREMMQHDHGEAPAEIHHSEETGHGPHKQ